MKSIPRRDALTILDAIGNLRDNLSPPQSMTLTGGDGWRLRVGNYRVIYTVWSRDTELFVVKAPASQENLQMFFTKRSQYRRVKGDA